MSAALFGRPISGDRFRLENRDGDRVAIVRNTDETEVGRIEFHAAGDVLHVTSLCVDEGARGFGAGTWAAVRLAEQARDSGYGHLRAWAPAELGLAVYFWRRIGLRPVFGNAREGDGISFELVLDARANP